MSEPGSSANRRPLYISLAVVGSSLVIVVAFGATAQNADPVFKTGASQVAGPPSVAPPALVALPAPKAEATRATAARTQPESKTARTAPFASTYRPVAATEVAADPVPSTQPSTKPAKAAKPKPGKHRAARTTGKWSAPWPRRTGYPHHPTAPHPVAPRPVATHPVVPATSGRAGAAHTGDWHQRHGGR